MTEFDAERPRLIALATRLLGSGADADDVLQEAWLRFSRAHDIDVLPAWLTTVVTRLCLDHLRRQRVQSAAARAPSLDPITGDPQSDSLLAEQVGEAMKVVVDALAPAERVAFIMHDVFAFSFDEIGAAMGRSSNAVRQLASRARRKFHDQPEPDEVRAADADSRRVVNAFLAAARGGDLDVLLSLLAPDAVMRPDAVARTMGTETMYEGASAVAARFNGSRGATPATIDGELGAAWYQAGAAKVVFVFRVEAGLIREIELIADSEVLALLDVHRVRTNWEALAPE